MRTYNVGLETVQGSHVGFHVTAENMDAAIAKARAHASTFWQLRGGSMAQWRDENANNEYFDRSYKFVESLK